MSGEEKKVTPKEFAGKIFEAAEFDLLNAFTSMADITRSVKDKDFFNEAYRELLLMHVNQVGDAEHRRLVLMVRTLLTK